jgi:hypothetical protein
MADQVPEVVQRAIALARQRAGAEGHARQLAGVGRDELERARMELVRRISLRSDDYEATAALSLVNRALAIAGWENPYDWRHRRKP